MATYNVHFGVKNAQPPGSMTFFLDDEKFTQKMMLDFFKSQKPFEPKLSEFLANFLSPGDVFVDIGGHIGYFSMVASLMVGSDGKVVTFEPEWSNYQHILKHIEMNRLTNVVPLPWAVNAKTGVVQLFISGNDGGHAIWDLRTGPYEAGVADMKQKPAFGVALDDVRYLFPKPPRMIKIDVEGVEVEVLRGAVGLLAEKNVSFVICECHRAYLHRMGQSEQSLRKFMTDLGYEVFADAGEDSALIPLPAGASLNTNMIFNLIFALPNAMKPSSKN